MAATYGDMQNRIIDELGGRTDLAVAGSGLSTTPVQYAILDAISYWENERFYFNEIRTDSAFSTVVGQEFYTSSDWSVIPDIHEIDKMTVTVSNNRYFMEPRTQQYMEDVSVSTTNTGMPIDYCYYNQKLRFYPIPNGVYPINVSYTKFFTALSASSDSNVWTTDGEALIRQTAKWFLCRDVTKDDIGAARYERAAKQAYSSLKGETMGRSASHRIRTTYF